MPLRGDRFAEMQTALILAMFAELSAEADSTWCCGFWSDWQFQFLGADGDDGEGAGLVGGEVGVYFFHGDGVDGGFNFVEGSDSAADEEVVGDGAGAGAGAFAGHDGAGFDAGLGAGEFGGGDALAEAVEFDDEAVEGGLGAVVAGAGVAHDAAAVVEADVVGRDVVDEGAFFADFGEEAAAHAAGEDFYGHADDVVVGVGFGDRGVGDTDVGLLAGLVDVVVMTGGRHFDDGVGGGAGPVTEMFFDFCFAVFEFDVPGDGEDCAFGLVAAGEVGFAEVEG